MMLTCRGLVLVLLCFGGGAFGAAATFDASREPDVVISYEGRLDEFPRHAIDGQYTVEIPEANRSRLMRGDTSACTSAGEATVWTFPSPPGSTAVLRHRPGRVEITFSPAPLASRPVATRRDDAPPALEMPDLPIIAEGPDKAALDLMPAPPAAGALAQQPISLASFALEVPDSPAFAVLGLTPETGARPSNPQELVTSLLNGLDQHGNFQTGLALDVAPYLLFFGKEVTLGHYQESYVTRVLTRTQLSLATSKGVESDDPSTRLALGIHLTLLDRGDPRFDLDLQDTYNAIDEQVRGPRGPLPPALGMEQQAAEIEEQMRPLFKAAFAEARRRNWNRTNWSLGAAPSWIRPGEDNGDYRWNGATVWTSLTYGFEGVPMLEEHSQLLLHARYRNQEEVPEVGKAGAFIRQDSVAVGARLRIGDVETNFSFDGAYLREWNDRHETTAYRVSLGLERRMTENLWLSLSLGKELGRDDGEDPLLILGTFKLGYGQKPAALAPRATGVVPVVLREPSPVHAEVVAPSATRSARLAAGRAATAKVARPRTPVEGREARLGGPEKTARPATPTGGREAALPSDPSTEKTTRPKTPQGREATLPGEPTGPAKTKRPGTPISGREATLPDENAPSLGTQKSPRPATPQGAREAGEAAPPPATGKVKRPFAPAGGRDATVPQ